MQRDDRGREAKSRSDVWPVFAWGFWLTALLAAGLYYPMTVWILAGAIPRLAYEVTLGLLPVSVLAVPYAVVLILQRRPSPSFVGLTVLYTALVLCSAGFTSATPGSTLESLGRIGVPLAAAGCYGALNSWGRRLVYFGFGLIWITNVVVVVVWGNGSGMSGNPNWMAATIVASAPLAFAAMVPDRPAHSWKARPGRFYVACVIAGLTLLCAYLASVRATAVAIVAYFGLRVLERLRLRWRVAFIAAVVTVCIGLALSRPARLDRLHLADVRIPMWHSTVRMICARPLLGFGPGAYQRDIVYFETNELKRRIQIGAVTEHPHNEVLHLASTLGIGATLVWLYVIARATLKSDGSADYERIRFAVLTLFFHGCFDKALSVSQSCVLFPLLLGIACHHTFVSRRPVDTIAATRPWTMAGRIGLVSASLVVTVFGAKQAIDEIRGEVHFRRAQVALSAAYEHERDPSQARAWAELAYASMQRACDASPNRSIYHFFAGMIASEELGRADQGRSHFHSVREIEPHFGFAAFMTGRAWLFDALRTPDRATRCSCGTAAAGNIEQNRLNHPFTPCILEDGVLADYLRGDLDGALAADREAVQCYQSRFAIDSAVDGVSTQERLEQWRMTDPTHSSRLLGLANALVDGERMNELRSLSWLFVGGDKFPTIAAFVRQKRYYSDDVLLWQGFKRLDGEFARVGSADQMIEKLSEVRISEQRNDRWHWPWEVWRGRYGSRLELACLAATVCEMHGNPAVIVRDEDETGLLFEWDGARHVWITSQQRVLKLDSPTDWQVAWSSAVNEAPGHEPRPSVFLLAYPHGCAPRHRALFGVLRLDEREPFYPDNPIVTLSVAQSTFDGLTDIEFLTEPFRRLEEDLAE